ncbi:MAG: transcriptional regulator [Chitinophagaceae bacterium]|nr:transcriptional regulator [Chitinophagaceae bacterium]
MKLLLLLFLLPFQALCQNTIGLPDIINYSKPLYKAGLQNWDIKQDKNGIVYFANNEGLLSFDGRYWNNYPLPNKTIVRSVEIGPNNRIYAGGQDEIGYFSPAGNGRLQYHTLIDRIPVKDRSFGDVWDIVSFNGNTYFRSPTKIFKFTERTVVVYNAANEWAFLGICSGKLYAQDFKTGLLKFENEIWVPVSGKNTLPANDAVTGILSINPDTAIITTLKNGLYSFSNNGIYDLGSVNNTIFKNERIYAATAVNKDWMALATNNNGVYITDFRGNIIQSFSQTEGLQNNNVLSIFSDSQRNLWLGLDNGIDLITYNSSIKQIKPLLQDGSGYTALLHDNRLFLGTSNGLFSVPVQSLPDMSFSKGSFTAVNNTKGQTWGLARINNQLLLGHHEGAFAIKNNNAIPISTDKGFWNFVPLSNTFPSGSMVAGGYTGLTIFDYVNGQFIQSKVISGFHESSRFVVLDNDSNIWVSHPYHGVFKIVPNEAGSYSTFAYSTTKGLPSLLNNHIYTIKNELVVATEKGIYVYNKEKDSFVHSEFYHKLLGDQSIRYLKEDNNGNTWFIHEKSLGVIDFSKKEPAVIQLPELNNKMLSGFEFIYAVNGTNIFLGGDKGFYHINYEKYKQTLSKLGVQIRTVRIINKTDSLLFGGYYNTENKIQDPDNVPSINYRWKTLRIEYSSSLFGYQANLEYSYRLTGYDNNWSEWTSRTEKEYTNLPAGKFSFEVKVRNNLGNESATATYSFNVLPPWYKTNWANALYLVIIATGLYFLYTWQEKKFKQQQDKYEEEQKRLRYIHDLEIAKTESELVALRNEKLEADINFKNSELASSAMHLVKKSELVSKMKMELGHVMKGVGNPQAETELKKIIKSISEDDNMDREWENFALHFDKVHSDFISALKEKHPGISNNEVKLCAYLRMNLSTKEIAQLMNISVRGVEVSRYRLRKKLELATEVSLFDYLISIQTKNN